MKVLDKIKERVERGETFFSFEFFPPRTDEGVLNLWERMDRMVSYQPMFCDITWGAGGTTSELTLDIAHKMQNMICVETMMHLTCTNMPVEKIDVALSTVKESGLQNILALRGDPPKGEDNFTAAIGGFGSALDLVKHIRKEYGDYFGITVAGYPEAHPDVIVDDAEQMKLNYRSDLEYLKKKVDAGAEVIVTQLFYDVDTFLKFVNDCREIGITVPILPGIMPLQTYNGFKRMTGFCKTFVPQEITDALEPIKDNEDAVKSYGIHLGTEMCRKILASGLVPGLHMYSLNLEKAVVSILTNLGLITETKVYRELPWRPATNVKRQKEDVRPIFWANRPKSYLSRTSDWDSYPSGRWGDSRSPAYGTLSDYQFMRPHVKKAESKLSMWGEKLASEEDVFSTFAGYCSGTVALLPWSEMETLSKESSPISEELVRLNKAGYLTINSQPSVNGLPSSHRVHGWGPRGGIVYQKAYVEFFCSKDKLDTLLKKIDGINSAATNGAAATNGGEKSANMLTYIAVNAKGEKKTNTEGSSVTAVTWGVFPGREILQPTVVDPISFMVWKDEAFDLWTSEWGSVYGSDSDDDKKSLEVLQKVKDTYFLVSLVDNDFVNGDIFKLFY